MGTVLGVSRKRMHGLWHGLLCLCLAAFFLRALIPTGYMPTAPKPAQSGLLSLSFCLPQGSSQAAFEQFLQDLNQDLEQHSEQAGSIHTCPYNMAAADAAVLPSDTRLSIWVPGAHFVLPESRAPPLLTIFLGSPLGPRAPPLA